MLDARELRNRVGDLRQVASVRRFVLSEGAEAGIDTLSFSTGGGLDFWVTAGRLLDVALLSWRGVQIAWQSPAGLRKPQSSLGDRSFTSAFGGFLNTCGFDHIRQPAGGKPLHGSAPFSSVRLTSYGEDWNAERPYLFCDGEAVIWSWPRGGHRLTRRIEAPIGGTSFRIRDRIEVVGPEPIPIHALYHFNIGYPMLGEGTSVNLNGEAVLGPLPRHEEIAPSPTVHAVGAESASCRVDGHGEIALEFRWSADSLPWLQLARDLRQGRSVLSIEPCSTGKDPDGRNMEIALTRPGQSRTFDLEIELNDCRRDSHA